MTWTVSRVIETCGAEPGCTIPAGQAIASFNHGKNLRCEAHAWRMGYTLDAQELENERWRLEQELAREASARLEAADRPPRYAPRITPYRKPVPISAVAGSIFDHKAAAAGDRD